VVESEGYFATLSRYIHLNPVRVESARGLPLEERRRVLAQFRWSSFRALIGQVAAPRWLKTEGVLQGFGPTAPEQMHGYRLYVEEGLMREVRDPAEAARGRSILGSDTFVEWLRREFLLRRVGGEDEQEELRRLQSGFQFEAVLGAAALACGVRAAVLRSRCCRNRQARDLLAGLARRYCRGTMSAGALARAMGLSYSGFVHASERARARAGSGDPAWGKAVSHLAQEDKQISV
jgi:hypothetical protein